jgi:hypothetical protein
MPNACGKRFLLATLKNFHQRPVLKTKLFSRIGEDWLKLGRLLTETFFASYANELA